ncbi:hypothetical protein MW887_002948 [Aspergillus wentii]|nr:hypothetical protein MW887_002948 [Aspergillus wentii]
MARADQKGSFLGAISPWNTSRNSIPQPATNQIDGQDVLQRSQGEDHTVTRRHRLSLRQYPKDCPLLRVRWFYAVDSPKRKPMLSDYRKDDSKPLPPPKKFVPFSLKDSQSIETSFQRLSDLEAAREQSQSTNFTGKAQDDTVKVPVNEDYLFDVDVEQRELSPAYWVGPVYEVRRGTWFFQEGSTFKPCEENLATQLEEGYLKVRPWQFEDTQKPLQPPTVSKMDEYDKASTIRGLQSNPGASDTMRHDSLHGHSEYSGNATSAAANESHNYRLFGAYMNSIVTYQDSFTALLTNDDFMSRVSTTVYQKLGGIAGTRVMRGFTEAKKQKETPDTRGPDRNPLQGSPSSAPQGASMDFKTKSGTGNSRPGSPVNQGSDSENFAAKNPKSTIERQMSSLAGEPQNAAELEEQARRQEEKEMEDSREVENEDRERDIDHLVLVTHGIGQRLGLRLESINFIHDVNVLRKTMKGVYKASPDLQALNSASADSNKNCRVQVLPVCWRHLLDFPYRGVRQNRKELDLADADILEDDMYPGLADITLESVPAVRNLISDLAMDVLLYQSAYCEHISTIVRQECNRILKLFKERNPSFKGSVSLCGHSLGSAILFDILCRQQSDSHLKKKRPPPQEDQTPMPNRDYSLDFQCEELFCLGSPIALFQMLKGKTIAGRSTVDPRSSNINSSIDVPEFSGSSSAHHSVNARVGTTVEAPAILSSPHCRQLYNIFHPSDPVSYRIEPLISPVMSTLKPQPLPSVKKSLWATSGQSLSILGSRVGQSVGSLWTNFTSGVASSLLNRSLGLSHEDTPPRASGAGFEHQQTHLPPAADLPKRKPRFSGPDAELLSRYDDRPRTLIEPELETLYDGFQKVRSNHTNATACSSASGETIESQEHEDRLKKLKIEDAKVRALNSNGRVDYSIQE